MVTDVAGHDIWSTPEIEAEFEEPELGPAVFMLSVSQVMVPLQSSITFNDWRAFVILYQRGAVSREERPGPGSGQHDTPTNPPRHHDEHDSPVRGGTRPGPGGHSRGESVPRVSQHHLELADREYMPRGERYYQQRQPPAYPYPFPEDRRVVAGRRERSRMASMSPPSSHEMRRASNMAGSGYQRHGSASYTNLAVRPRRDDPRRESEHTRLGVGPSRQMPMDSDRTQKIHHSIPVADVLSSERDSYVSPGQTKHRGRKNEAPVSSSPNNTDVDEESVPAAIKSDAVDRNPSRRSRRGAKGKNKIAPLAVATPEVIKPDEKVYPQLPVVAKPEVSGKAPPPVSMGIEQRPVAEAPIYLFPDIDYEWHEVDEKEPHPPMQSQLDELWRDQLQRLNLDKPGLYGLKPSQLGSWRSALNR